MFRSISYAYMLFDALRSYFSINSSGNLSILYKICLSIIWPLQAIFDEYDALRIKLLIIAKCKWQIGQVENVLNYLYDPIYKRINISQSIGITGIYFRNFDDSPGAVDPVYARNFDDSPSITTVYLPNFNSIFIETNQAQINIPFVEDSPEWTDIDATVNMIRLKGTTYKLNTI